MGKRVFNNILSNSMDMHESSYYCYALSEMAGNNFYATELMYKIFNY